MSKILHRELVSKTLFEKKVSCSRYYHGCKNYQLCSNYRRGIDAHDRMNVRYSRSGRSWRRTLLRIGFSPKIKEREIKEIHLKTKKHSIILKLRSRI